jgi:hypothetical protein
MIALAISARLATFLRKVWPNAAASTGAACSAPCRIDPRNPRRIAVLLKDASALFSGQVRYAPARGDHGQGCSTRP